MTASMRCPVCGRWYLLRRNARECASLDDAQDAALAAAALAEPGSNKAWADVKRELRLAEEDE